MTGTSKLSERRVLFWMCVLIGVNQLGFGSIVPAISLYAQSFGVTATAIGMAVAVYGLARMISAQPAGTLSDKLGRRPTLALGGIITSLGNLACALADTYPEFIIGRFVAGAGAGLVLTTGQIVLADISTPERRGRVISIYQGTFIFAVGIGPFPGGIIADAYGLRAPFLAYAVLGLLCSCVAWLAVGETRDFASKRDGGEAVERPPYLQQLRMLAAKRGYVLVCMVSLMFAVIRTGGMFSLIPLIGSISLGLTVTEIGLGLFLGSIAGLVAAFPGGMISDRFGRKAVIVPASLVTASSLTVFAFAEGYQLFMTGCIVWGVATSVGGAAPAAYAADNAPPGLNATTMSTFRMVGDLGYVIGPMLLGFIADASTPSVSLIIGSIMMVCAALVFGVLAPESYTGGKRSKVA